jgi:mono/diheme cytochrome c family protein
MAVAASADDRVRGLRALGGLPWMVVSLVLFRSGLALAGPEDDQIARGRALFSRQWRPNDSRSHSGGGLGPVYNEASCVACHSQGGPGGAGPVAKNAELLTFVGWSDSKNGLPVLKRALIEIISSQLDQTRRQWWPDPARHLPTPFDQITAAVAARRKVHPGFEEAPTVVLHRFGTSPSYGSWRSRLARHATSRNGPKLTRALTEYHAIADPRTVLEQGPLKSRESCGRGPRVRGLPPDPTPTPLTSPSPGDLVLAGRNTPPLFGAGLIDAIDASDIEAGRTFQDPHIRGRMIRLKDGRIGRFGWKAQVASLDDFVLTACANELGLEVPGHHQAASPLAPSARPPGLDMIQEECDDLVAYVRSLAQPIELDSPDPSHASQGRALFDSIGCAGCHTPTLGKVKGIYSDLLLHSMGQELSDDGVYYGDSSSGSSASSEEWRTPPLWGLRTSGPFLHDGRAANVTEAVAFHGGQGEQSRHKFFSLEAYERRDLLAFLDTLSAPGGEGNTTETTAPPLSAPRGEGNTTETTAPPSRLPRPPVRGKLRAAEALERLGKIDAALDFYRDLVSLAPDSAEARTAAERIAALRRGQPPKSD